MGDGTMTVRREGAFWFVRAGDVVLHRAASKPQALRWASGRTTSVYVENLSGRLARFVPDRNSWAAVLGDDGR